MRQPGWHLNEREVSVCIVRKAYLIFILIVWRTAIRTFSKQKWLAQQERTKTGYPSNQPNPRKICWQKCHTNQQRSAEHDLFVSTQVCWRILFKAEILCIFIIFYVIWRVHGENHHSQWEVYSRKNDKTSSYLPGRCCTGGWCINQKLTCSW